MPALTSPLFPPVSVPKPRCDALSHRSNCVLRIDNWERDRTRMLLHVQQKITNVLTWNIHITSQFSSNVQARNNCFPVQFEHWLEHCWSECVEVSSLEVKVFKSHTVGPYDSEGSSFEPSCYIEPVHSFHSPSAVSDHRCDVIRSFHWFISVNQTTADEMRWDEIRWSLIKDRGAKKQRRPTEDQHESKIAIHERVWRAWKVQELVSKQKQHKTSVDWVKMNRGVEGELSTE